MALSRKYVTITIPQSLPSVWDHPGWKKQKGFFWLWPPGFSTCNKNLLQKGGKVSFELSIIQFIKKLNPNIQYTQENVADCKITKNLVKPEKRVLFQSAHRQIMDSINAHNEIPSFMW